MNPTDKALFQISSVMEYLIDRGEVEDIEGVVTQHVRYGPQIPISHVDLICGGELVRVTAQLHQPSMSESHI